jgi:hypothetical protein
METTEFWRRFVLEYINTPIPALKNVMGLDFLLNNEMLGFIVAPTRLEQARRNLPVDQQYRVFTMDEWMRKKSECPNMIPTLEPELIRELLIYLTELGDCQRQFHSEELNEVRGEYKLQLSELRDELEWKCDEKLDKLAIKKNQEIEQFKTYAHLFQRRYTETLEILKLGNKTPLVLIALSRLYRKVPKPYKSIVGSAHYYVERILKPRGAILEKILGMAYYVVPENFRTRVSKMYQVVITNSPDNVLNTNRYSKPE